MRLLIYSDLHIDQNGFKPILADGSRADKDVDVVVLAGDIDEGVRGIRWGREAFPDKPVIYVSGNHEMYGKNWIHHIDDMREAALKNDVEFLEADGIDIGGVRFLGATLWTDMELFGEANRKFSIYQSKARMMDYREIRISKTPELHWVHGRYLIPELTVLRHRASVEWLERKLAKGDPSKTVVITHHAPHQNSVPERFKSDPLSAAYASDLTRLMGKCALWIHGHIHDSVDFEIGGTRVVCNPLGYTEWHGVENEKFKVDGIWTI